MAVSMTSTHLHACQHHNRGGGAATTRMPVTTLQQQSGAGNTSIPPPSSTAVLPSGHILAPHHQHYNPVANPSIQHQPMMSIPPPGPPTGPPMHSAPPPLPPPPLPPGVPPPLLGIANISPGAKIVQHGHQNHRITVRQKHYNMFVIVLGCAFLWLLLMSGATLNVHEIIWLLRLQKIVECLKDLFLFMSSRVNNMCYHIS